MDIYMIAHQMLDGSYKTSRICFDNLEKAQEFLARAELWKHYYTEVRRVVIIKLTAANIVDSLDILHVS